MSYDDSMELGQKILYISLAASFSVLAAASSCKIGLMIYDYQETTNTKNQLNETVKLNNGLEKFVSNYTFLKYDDDTDTTTATIYGQAVDNGITKNLGFEYLVEDKEEASKYSNLLLLSKSDKYLDYTEEKAYRYLNELVTLVKEGKLIDNYELSDEQNQKLNNQIKALLNNANIKVDDENDELLN